MYECITFCFCIFWGEGRRGDWFTPSVLFCFVSHFLAIFSLIQQLSLGKTQSLSKYTSAKNLEDLIVLLMNALEPGGGCWAGDGSRFSPHPWKGSAA